MKKIILSLILFSFVLFVSCSKTENNKDAVEQSTLLTEEIPNSAEADSLLKLAEQGDVNAQFNLGVSYYNGEGVSQS